MDNVSQSNQESCFSGDAFVDFTVLFMNLVLVGYVLYAFHVICDGYFVPALQLLCSRNNIPDVIGGATIMAAGASSPELITNAVSLFALKSNVGTGTVVGSELFNMVSKIMYSPSCKLPFKYLSPFEILKMLGMLIFKFITACNFWSFGACCWTRIEA